MKPNRTPALKIFARWLALACVAAFSGCASVNHLREAQEAFNEASALANDARFESFAKPPTLDAALAAPSAAIDREARIRALYASALVSLDQAGADEAKLRADGLLGTAETLRALTFWRLGAFAKAVAAAEAAAQLGDEQLLPRDKILLRAVPSLVHIDEAFDLMQKESAAGISVETLARIDALLIGASGAIDALDAQCRVLASDDPMLGYLLQAKLAGYANYKNAHLRAADTATVHGLGELTGAAAATVNAFETHLRTRGVENTPPLVLFWQATLSR
jgi:hypothetical protein